MSKTSQYATVYTCNVLSSSTDTPPEPEIKGLEKGLSMAKHQHITCHVRYHWSENVTFAWELDGGIGHQLSTPGFLESVIQHMNNTATLVWVLNYTLDTDHSGYRLRCVVRVDNKIHSNYKAVNEANICFCGK